MLNLVRILPSGRDKPVCYWVTMREGILSRCPVVAPAPVLEAPFLGISEEQLQDAYQEGGRLQLSSLYKKPEVLTFKSDWIRKGFSSK